MRNYKKLHESKKVANTHQKSIIERGGKAKIKTINGNIIVEYNFPSDDWIEQKVFLFNVGNKKYEIRNTNEKWELEITKSGGSIYSGTDSKTIKRDSLNEIKEWLIGYKIIDTSWIG